METIKLYFIADRKGARILETIREKLKEIGLYREFALFQKSAGRSGDLGAETMEYEIHRSGSEGGYTVGSVHLYSVMDDTCNGYAHMLSVLIHLPHGVEKDLLIPFLEELEFVGRYSSFRERPIFFHSYMPYLDSIPDMTHTTNQFSNEQRRRASATA